MLLKPGVLQRLNMSHDGSASERDLRISPTNPEAMGQSDLSRFDYDDDKSGEELDGYDESKRKKNGAASDEEYLRKRARNNIAVKKSRERSKRKIMETQKRVEILTQENEELQTKVTLLTKELNVLRALFTNGGFTLPCDLQQAISGNHSSPSQQPYQSSHSPSVIHLGPTSVELDISASKSAFRSLSDPHKFAPVRPTPMIVRDLSASPDMHQHSPIESCSPRSSPSNYSPSSYIGRGSTAYHSATRLEPMAPNSVFGVVHRPSSLLKNIKKEEDLPRIVQNIIHPGAVSLPSPSYSYNRREADRSSRSPQSSGRQETSVIRNISTVTEKVSDSPSSISEALLGKFCVIQDPANNGSIKIVPIDG